jgi:hypothetical protein
VPLAMRSLPRGGPRPDPRRGAGFQFFDNTRRHSCVEITFHSTAPLLQRAVVFYKPPRTVAASRNALFFWPSGHAGQAEGAFARAHVC